MKKVFVTIPEGTVLDTFLPGDIRGYLQQHFDVTYNDTGRKMTKEELAAVTPNYDAFLTGWGTVGFDRENLPDNDRLKLIVHTGGTVGNLVNDDVYDKGIRVLSGNQLYAESVAEGTIAYILMGLRRIPDYVQLVKDGGWRSTDSLWEGLSGRSVGIVGLGTISKILIRMLQPFRVRIKMYSHHEIDPEFVGKYGVEPASLEEIFSECDVVTVHSALNKENTGLITKEHFQMLKDGCLFINTSRGRVIDEQALILELEKDRFRAVLDVYWTEPLEQESKLRSLNNVYCIPHMAGPTLDLRKWITKAIIDEMRAFFDGEDELKLEITREYAKRMTGS